MVFHFFALTSLVVRAALAQCNAGDYISASFATQCESVICTAPFGLGPIPAYSNVIQLALNEFCGDGFPNLPQCGPCTTIYYSNPGGCCNADDPAACFAEYQSGLSCAANLVAQESAALASYGVTPAATPMPTPVSGDDSSDDSGNGDSDTSGSGSSNGGASTSTVLSGWSGIAAYSTVATALAFGLMLM